MSKPKETDTVNSEKGIANTNTAELEKLKARHDAVHHMPAQGAGSGLTGRGKSLEDEWIYRQEKLKAKEAKAREEKEKGNKETKTESN